MPLLGLEKVIPQAPLTLPYITSVISAPILAQGQSGDIPVLQRQSGPLFGQHRHPALVKAPQASQVRLYPPDEDLHQHIPQNPRLLGRASRGAQRASGQARLDGRSERAQCRGARFHGVQHFARRRTAQQGPVGWLQSRPDVFRRFPVRPRGSGPAQEIHEGRGPGVPFEAAEIGRG